MNGTEKNALRTLRPIGRRELLDGDQTQIVDILTFECECRMPRLDGKVKLKDMKCVPAPSEILYFDDSIPESEQITDIFYRWQVTTKDMVIHVCAFRNISIPSKYVTWITSQGQILHCIDQCPGIYNMNSDIKHYCTFCNRWFHIRCIKRGRRQKTPTLSEILTFWPTLDHSSQGDQKDLLQVLMAPIERGGIFGVSGNGQAQLRMRSLVSDAEGVTSDWMGEMDSSYVKQVLEMDFTYFDCPCCMNII